MRLHNLQLFILEIYAKKKKTIQIIATAVYEAFLPIPPVKTFKDATLAVLTCRCHEVHFEINCIVLDK